MSEIEKIGQIVKAGTVGLQKPISGLARRSLADLIKLDRDPELLRLVEIIKRSNRWEERVRAWQKVRKMGPLIRGWEASLKDLINNADGWAGIFAAESFSAHVCCEEEAVPVLIATLEATLDLRRYDWARMACGAIGQYIRLSGKLIEKAVPVLIRALDSDDHNVRGYAARTLGKWGPLSRAAIYKLWKLLNRTDDPMKASYFEVLQKIDPSIKNSLDALTAALRDPDPDIRIKILADVASKGKAAAKALPRLLILSGDDSPSVRRFLAFSLGQIRFATSEVIATLRTLANDIEPSVRLAASHALIRFGVDTEHHLNFLILGLNSKDRTLRLMSAGALRETGHLNRRLSISSLKKALKTENDEEIQETIKRAINHLKKGWPKFLKMLSNREQSP
ncbi:MAG TPA: HEAT repeat domain-containing protein [Desulfobacterales bacterium]|nr:HEAT repeat domain-containing protein [Desulfobacterales bacterium]